MSLRDEALALRGTRVRALFADSGEELVQVLRFVTPRGNLVFANQVGRQTVRPLEDCIWIEAAQHVCPSCGAHVNYVFPGREDETELCADCSRRRAAQLPPPTMVCEACGRDGAVRSPVTDAWRCMPCHAKHGTASGLAVERRAAAALSADCHGADTEDPRHDWHKVNGKRYHCRACGARRFTEPVAP
jgi:hypothetical protein